MNFSKMTVKLANGHNFVFERQGKTTALKVYDQQGKRVSAVVECIGEITAVIGKPLKFEYDSGISIDEYQTTSLVSTVETI